MAMLIGVTALLLAGSAQAVPDSARGTVLLQDLATCGEVADAALQLACYRRAADALVRAQATGTIVLIDREAARTVQRQAFGLTLPALALFAPRGADDELDSLTGAVRTARQDSTGRWILQLDSGATWTQVETVPLRGKPRPGTPVVITRAALGSYKMKVGDQHAVRVRRLE